MAVLRKKVESNGKIVRPSRLKRVAIGATVVGAFVAGAVAGVNKNKIKAFAKKTGRNIKSKVRSARRAAVNKAADMRDRVNERVSEARDSMNERVSEARERVNERVTEARHRVAGVRQRSTR